MKYYCTNGEYQVILQANDIKSAARKMLSKMLANGLNCYFLSAISERGFALDAASPICMIPLVKELDIDLPPDEILIDQACKNVGINPKNLSQRTINWLLRGDEGDDGDGFGED